ncbi:hypothetical protein L6164_006772 [Bauhinia variegata]|uniref:Uncharacterized protein n=1 Tax=Bauhinia variegata TaxID=167791 RepID=A0ACB9PXL0_BAUVA|nr:hypothetical protein L6164_006772 [Bauhinia variegata]
MITKFGSVSPNGVLVHVNFGCRPLHLTHSKHGLSFDRDLTHPLPPRKKRRRLRGFCSSSNVRRHNDIEVSGQIAGSSPDTAEPSLIRTTLGLPATYPVTVTHSSPFSSFKSEVSAMAGWKTRALELNLPVLFFLEILKAKSLVRLEMTTRRNARYTPLATDDNDYYDGGSNRSFDPRFDYTPNSLDKIPWKSIALALFLLFLGMGLLFLSFFVFTGHMGGDRSQAYGLLALGILSFLPGFYETRVAYYAWRGAKGYRFSAIPDY